MINLLFTDALTAIVPMRDVYVKLSKSLSRSGFLCFSLSLPELFLPSQGIPLPQYIASIDSLSRLVRTDYTMYNAGFEYVYRLTDLVSHGYYNSLAEKFFSLSYDGLYSYAQSGILFLPLIYRDMALSHKIHDFSCLTDDEKIILRSHFLALSLSLTCFDLVVSRQEFDFVSSFEEYSIHSLLRIHSCNIGITHRYFTSPQHNNIDFTRVEISETSLTNLRRTRANLWYDRYLSFPKKISREIFEASLNDSLYRLTGVSPHVYSPGISNIAADRHPLYGHFNNQDAPLVLVITSSLDERIASSHLSSSLGEYLPNRPTPFVDQLDWLKSIYIYSIANPNINFIVRLHPRLFKDKRGQGTSQYYFNILSFFNNHNIPLKSHNFFICLPDNPLSTYTLLLLCELVLNGWSTVGLEALRLGIPVINAFGSNGSACYWPSDLFPIAKSSIQYFSLIDKYFQIHEKFKSIPFNHSSFLASHYFYYYMFFSSSVEIDSIDNSRTLKTCFLSPLSHQYFSLNKLTTYHANEIDLRCALEILRTKLTDLPLLKSSDYTLELPILKRLELYC